MVDARKGDGDHLERAVLREGLGGVGVVGDHDDLGPGAAAGELGRIGGLGVIGDKLVAGLAQGSGQLVDGLGGNAERFEQCDTHG